ncbi:MAG: hypothetical protein Q7R70_03995 [Candidatus Diapherotrites archaeon]|nr:hypothetical protein [Candidatus Diapherotrites archaeon]
MDCLIFWKKKKSELPFGVKCPKCENANPGLLELGTLVGKQKAALGKCKACGYRGFLIKQRLNMSNSFLET